MTTLTIMFTGVVCLAVGAAGGYGWGAAVVLGKLREEQPADGTQRISDLHEQVMREMAAMGTVEPVPGMRSAAPATVAEPPVRDGPAPAGSLTAIPHVRQRPPRA